jgi:hypothetical protein
MADHNKTTIQILAKTHPKLKALAALSGCTTVDTLDEMVDTGLKARGIDPETMRAIND